MTSCGACFGEDITLDLQLDPNLGWVKVDRGQLQQMS